MRRFSCLMAFIHLIIALTLFEPATAQTPVSARRDSAPEFCTHARPLPACPGFVFTDFGVYVLKSGKARTPFRMVADWGVMPNIGAHDAIGLSAFASIDDDAGITAGPALHYRRWFGPEQSVDLALGTALLVSGRVEKGSLFGEFKWGPANPVALSIRGELLREYDWETASSRTRPRVSLGIVAREGRGLVFTFVGLLLALGWIAASAAD